MESKVVIYNGTWTNYLPVNSGTHECFPAIRVMFLILRVSFKPISVSNVPRDRFEPNSQHQKRFSDRGKKKSSVPRSAGKSISELAIKRVWKQCKQYINENVGFTLTISRRKCERNIRRA